MDYYIIGPFGIFGASWLNYIQIAGKLADVIKWDMYAFHTVQSIAGKTIWTNLIWPNRIVVPCAGMDISGLIIHFAGIQYSLEAWSKCVLMCVWLEEIKNHKIDLLMDFDNCQFYYDLSHRKRCDFSIWKYSSAGFNSEEIDNHFLQKLRNNRINSLLSDAINQLLIPSEA